METSSKFDLSSGSPDRPLHASGQRSYLAASLDRSSSFRENMENPISSALPSMSRSTSFINRGDVTSFLQCMRFDPKGIVTDHKLNRIGEFKRFAGLALAVPPDESLSRSSKGKVVSSSTEELKRFKIGLRESTIKARERVKIFNEGLLVIDKCFPNIPSRKRSRPDVLSGERSNALSASDRLVPGTTVGKPGWQIHMIGTKFEMEQQKPEGRSKNVFPNKRTRTSVMDPRIDVRLDTPARSSVIVDIRKEGLGLSNNSAAQGEDRTLILGAEGWEKSKMKKKRSMIKADIASSSAATKIVDGYKGLKRGVQPRVLSNGRPRSNAFRPGDANGIVVKTDEISQQTSLGIHSPVSRSGQDSSHSLQDRRDRAINSGKERVNTRDVNKINAREEFSSASPTSCPKLSAATRAPRSGSGIVPKLPPVVQRPTATKDWEISRCTNKSLAPIGAGNHKRPPSTRSSSPPVAQWASHRPQKMSRTARTNFVSIVSNNDDSPSLDTISDVVGSENGSGSLRRLSGNSPRQVKLKGDHFVSATLSESEESGTAEVKSRDNSKKINELDDKSGKNIQKVSPVLLPPRKNKVASIEDIRDGIQKQGRTGGGFSSQTPLMPLTLQKHGNMGTTKQLRSAKLGFAKAESKAGRPPTRKLSDRRAYAHQKQTTVNASADFLVGSDDGQEELLAAANSVINPAYAISSSFWRQTEPLFGLISDVDLDNLRQQRDRAAIASTPENASIDRELCNGISTFEHIGYMCNTQHPVLDPEDLASGAGMSSEVSLCQVLLSALISEDANEEPCGIGNEEELYTHESGSGENGQIEFGAFNHRSVQSFELGGCTGLNGYRLSSTGRSYSELEHDLSDKDPLSKSDMWISSGFDLFQNGFLPDHLVVMPVSSCSDIEYNVMSFNERALLEIQSIGLSAERLPGLTQIGDEEISRDISRLEDKYHDQVWRKKNLLDKLSKSTSEARELQEKGFEEAALDKLIGMAYKKYMGCQGRNAPGGKTASSKVAKQAALAFVTRTLKRCHQFELTGKSCFSEPLFKEMFRSRLSQFSDAQHAADTDGVNVLQSPSLSNHNMYSSGPLLSMNNPLERTIENEDTWSNRVKKRELLLDDVVGGVIGTSSTTPLGMGTSLSSSVKGKRSERDREGKGNNRDVSPRNETTRNGRTSGNVKGERKPKSKPKQKTTQVSAVNGHIAKMSEQLKRGLYSMPNPGETRSSTGKEENKFKLYASANSEAIDFSGMDVLDVPGDLGDQGEDFGSWLSIVDDGLPDDDFMGLEIPMDDLSELNMMV